MLLDELLHTMHSLKPYIDTLNKCKNTHVLSVLGVMTDYMLDVGYFLSNEFVRFRDSELVPKRRVYFKRPYYYIAGLSEYIIYPQTTNIQTRWEAYFTLACFQYSIRVELNGPPPTFSELARHNTQGLT